MITHTLIATSAFGIESIVAKELRRIDIHPEKIENGKVYFSGDERTIARASIWLRCAERIVIQMSEFRATDFEELYQGTRAIAWEDVIPENAKMHVVGKSVKSKLFSVPDCQSIVKRAIVDAMRRRYKKERFLEDGPVYKIEISLLQDIAALTMDTSGAGLHKRGYRTDAGEAPLKETTAAAMILLSGWKYDRLLCDPLCGSGTIPIEAAMIARSIAPGLNRQFAAELWSTSQPDIWKQAREEAIEKQKNIELEIMASDNDYHVFKKALENSSRAMVSDAIVFQKKPLSEFSSKKKFGFLITNPPYGHRLGDERIAGDICSSLGELYKKLDTWSFFILSAHGKFQDYFGMKALKNRKMYNGKIKCYYYQYLRDRPGKRLQTSDREE